MRRFLILPFVIAVTFACSPKQRSTDTDASSSERSPAKHQNVTASDSDYTASGIIANTLPEIISALEKGDLSSEDLVQQYLARIDKVDRNGPTLQSVLTLNPQALSEAKSEIRSVLMGISPALCMASLFCSKTTLNRKTICLPRQVHWR